MLPTFATSLQPANQGANVDFNLHQGLAGHPLDLADAETGEPGVSPPCLLDTVSTSS